MIGPDPDPETDTLQAIDLALEHEEETERLARLAAPEAEDRDALAVQAARDAVSTYAQALGHGCKATSTPREDGRRSAFLTPREMLARLARRARLVIAQAPEGDDRRALEEELARLSADADTPPDVGRPRRPRPERRAEAQAHEDQDQNEPEDQSEEATMTDEKTDTSGARRTPKRVRCSKGCGRRLAVGVGLANHERSCSAATGASAPASSSSSGSGATPEEAIGTARRALGELSPEVRKLALEILTATLD